MSDAATKVSVGKYDGTTGHMSFEIALDVMKRGGKVRRACWQGGWPPIFLDVKTGVFFDGPAIAGFDTDDILAEDWVEVF